MVRLIKLTRELRVLGVVSVLAIAFGAYQTVNRKPHRKGKPAVMARLVFLSANDYAQGKKVDITPQLSVAYQQQCRKLVGMLPIAARIATRAGTIARIDTDPETFISEDSVVVPMQITYTDGGTRKFSQSMVYENGWKVGLVFTKGEGGF